MLSDLPRWLNPSDADGNPTQPNWVVIIVGSATLVLEAWMLVEAMILWPKVKGIAEAVAPTGAPASPPNG
jgi:carbon starvation protein